MRNSGPLLIGASMAVLGLIAWIPVWFLRTVADNEPGRAPDNSEKETMEAVATVATGTWLVWMAIAVALVVVGIVTGWFRRGRSD